MENSKITPPSFILKLFRWFCHENLLQYIEGDLLELYEDNVKSKSRLAANWILAWEVLKLLRPSIIRPIDSDSSFYSVSIVANYLKVGSRNVMRHKVFSLINITGLGVGIASALVILIYVQNEKSYDNYHTQIDQLYRVDHQYLTEDQKENPSQVPNEEYQVWGCAPVGPVLTEALPEIESYCRFASPVSYLFAYEQKKFQEDELMFADSTAFDLFSWVLLAGNPHTALTRPKTVVLSEKMAKKYFGNGEAIGKILRVGSDQLFEVTGVMADIPFNSQIKFDGLVSMKTLELDNPEMFDWWGYVYWYTYLKIPEAGSLTGLAQKIPEVLKDKKPKKVMLDIRLEPMKGAYLNSMVGRQPGDVGNSTNLYVFTCIAVFVLLIASINFMNLSTARSIERAKEVGVRKTLGAVRASLVYQFLTESVLLAFLSGVLAIAIILFALPYLAVISGKPMSLEPYLNIQSILYFILAVGGLGLLSGLYPAWVLSRFKPSVVLKGKFKSSGHAGWLRKALVVFQFTLSMALIIGTTVVVSQLDYMQEHELGFTNEQMLIVDFGWDGTVQRQVSMIKNEYLAHPDVLAIAGSRAVPGDFFPNGGTNIVAPDGEKMNHAPAIYEIGPDFVETYEMEMAAGRDYAKEHVTDSANAMILNEAAAKLFGYSNPQDIIGKQFEQWGRKGKVIGVIKDFNYKSLHENVGPMALRYGTVSNLRKFSIKVRSEDMNRTVAELEAIWNELVPHRPFNFVFLDQAFNDHYQKDQQFGSLFSLFAGIAIMIACLGLFGLTIYSTAQRSKEIGIRKVLGASISSIVGLISIDFLKLVIVAALIAIPVSWYVMNIWLEGFAYRISIGADIFLIATLITLVIAMSTTGWQTLRAAIQNPVNSLKDE